MKKLILFALVTISWFAATAQGFYDVTKYGAKKDSSELATKPIADAIAAASKAGGGTVYCPAGQYLTGPIQL